MLPILSLCSLISLSTFVLSCPGHIGHGHANIQTASPPRKLALTDVRIFNGHGLSAPTTIVISGSHITDNIKDAEHFNASGHVLLPGLIDSHVHPTNITHLQQLARWGVTTGMTMACFSAAQCASLQNHTGLTNVFRSSAPAAAPGSAHGNLTSFVDHTGVLLVHNSSDAVRWTQLQMQSRPDYIKLIAEAPGLSQDTLNALVIESHSFGKKVVCHAATFSAYSQAVTAGVDQIHHSPLDKPITCTIAEEIKKNGRAVVPTLAIMKAIADTQSSTSSFNASLATAAELRRKRVPILAGTDANLQPGIVATVPFGTSLHEELELLVEAGLSSVEALRAATVEPARVWGLEDRGVVKVGMRADLVLVKGDPVRDVRESRNVKKVWIGGVEVEGVGA
ncbi:putative hydrolase [Lindgomyces ingoldianus]|uniref:Hydrolase n=1 Tax=Lindgomyces ingoldianus TaxID=673940 RepID=A0ACB6RA52_9PLEO|nr:putative hydrolase [Lindgomyces ingoldianus]KAF2475643.1 putative hydrolase [Lindgomyces ingoldianus]